MNDWRDDFDEKMWDTEVEIEREDRLRSNKGWRVAGIIFAILIFCWVMMPAVAWLLGIPLPPTCATQLLC